MGGLEGSREGFSFVARAQLVLVSPLFETPQARLVTPKGKSQTLFHYSNSPGERGKREENPADKEMAKIKDERQRLCLHPPLSSSDSLFVVVLPFQISEDHSNKTVSTFDPIINTGLTKKK